jgi:hypothetical protein
MFNIFYVESIESYWAIIIPLAFAVNTPDKAFKRQAQLKVNEIAASSIHEGGGGGENADEMVEKEAKGALRASKKAETMKLVAERVNKATSDLQKGVKSAVLRRSTGAFFFCVGGGVAAYINIVSSRQELVCEQEIGACVWGRVEPKL